MSTATITNVEPESFEQIRKAIQQHYGREGFAFDSDLTVDPPILIVQFRNRFVHCGCEWSWNKNGLLKKDGPEGVSKKCIELARMWKLRPAQIKIVDDSMLEEMEFEEEPEADT